MRIRLITLSWVICVMLSGCSDEVTDPVVNDAPTTTGTIDGTITQANTGAAVDGANIFTMPATGSTTTDGNGGYKIDNVIPGQYIVVAGKADYNGSRMVMVTVGQTTTADIPLNQNRLPDVPTLVAPSHNATDQPTNAQLIWNCSDADGDPLTFDLYVDSLCPPQTSVVTNHQNTRLVVYNLEPNNTYCWMVVAKDNKGGMMVGPVWQFTTYSLPYAEMWNMSDEYSSTKNPNEEWSYGRKWDPEGGSFDLMTVKWGDSGWYFGNVGHGGPSISAGVALWAKDNSNGLPCVRWVSPNAGYFNLSTLFKGSDSRGVNVVVYVAINDSTAFSGEITQNGDETEYSIDEIFLDQGEYIDFVVRWNGGVYSEYNWTTVNATINQY